MDTRRNTGNSNSNYNSHVDDWIENFGRNIFLPDFFDDAQSLLPVHSEFTGESRFENESIPSTNFQLNATIFLMKMENEDRKLEMVKTDVTALQNSLTGRWKLISCSPNLEDFLKRRGASEIYDVTFQLADVHFEFPTPGIMSTYEQMGTLKFHKRSFKLSEPQHYGRVSCISYICDNRLKTVYQLDLNNGDEEVEERFFSDNKLHIVIRRFGLTCSRIYMKIEEFQNLENQLELQNSNSELIKELQDKLFISQVSLIKNEMSGTWKNTDKSSVWRKISLKIVNDQFMRKWNDKEYVTWNLKGDEEGPDGFKAIISDNKVINVSDREGRIEYFVKDRLLIRLDYKSDGESVEKMVFRKVYK